MGRRSRGHSLTMPFVLQNKAFKTSSKGLCVLILYLWGVILEALKG